MLFVPFLPFTNIFGRFIITTCTPLTHPDDVHQRPYLLYPYIPEKHKRTDFREYIRKATT